MYACVHVNIYPASDGGSEKNLRSGCLAQQHNFLGRTLAGRVHLCCSGAKYLSLQEVSGIHLLHCSHRLCGAAQGPCRSRQ